MKNICILASAFVLTSTTAFSHAYGGFYAGVGVGAAIARSEHKFTNVASQQGKTTYTKFGGLYEVHAGYMQEIGSSRTMVGGELYAVGSTPKETENVGVHGGNVVGTVSIDRAPAYGVAAILGKLVNPKVMVYGKIAYEMAKYKLVYKGNTHLPALSQTAKSTYNGVVTGFGIGYKVTSNIMVGGEYNYAGLYGNEKVVNKNGFTCELNPGEHRFSIRASYLF